MRVQSANPVSQTAISWIEGSPEGVYKAPPGFIIVDRANGAVYFKSTQDEFNTGWIQIGGSPGGGAGNGFFPQVNSFQAVRDTVNPVLFKAVLSWGYASPSDGVLRIWRWEPTETGDDNDGNILESSFTSVGRWVQAL